jgi:O-antigen/teichoic acid export membrane protein
MPARGRGHSSYRKKMNAFLKTGSLLFLVRGTGVAMAALGGIWAARTLGPEKLGISTFVFAFVNLVVVLTSLNQDFNLVRRGKLLRDPGDLESLVGQVFSLRLGLCLILLLLGLLVVALNGVGDAWYLAIAAGSVMALAQSNDAGWILQLRNRMPRFFLAISVQGIVTGLLTIAVVRSAWPAGSDLAMGAIGALVGAGLAWFWACGGWPPGFRIGVRQFCQGLRLLKGGRWLALMGLGTYLLSMAELPMIGSLASVEDLGVYRTAQQFINVINPFVPLLFYKLYPLLIDLQQSDPARVLPTQFSALGRLAAFGLPLILIAFFVAPLAYPLVFGAEYAAAALPFAVLFASKVVSVGVKVFMWGAFARHHDRGVVLSVLAIAALALGANALLIPKLGIMAAASINFGAQALLLIICIGIMLRSRRTTRA